MSHRLRFIWMPKKVMLHCVRTTELWALIHTQEGNSARFYERPKAEASALFTMFHISTLNLWYMGAQLNALTECLSPLAITNLSLQYFSLLEIKMFNASYQLVKKWPASSNLTCCWWISLQTYMEMVNSNLFLTINK